ncbi:hypothetical protein J8G26_08770 [Acidovorax sp. JG5]|uniref:helix-turn-helix domain-containing protein n=1 Tax=Acidovorax sp. JG5 TaxID=2822718 RepID=UPI001B31FED6|nr:helix-turn-helix domain-containing protein [Acidovorax sp. JG5]MBP3980818.1 hypothetical protein [Acidovorax sp. JG5]
MSDAALLDRIDKMTSAMQLMAAMLGTRLDRGQLAERLGIHRNTLTKRLAEDSTFPRQGRDGKWLLSEVIEWEQRQ